LVFFFYLLFGAAVTVVSIDNATAPASVLYCTGDYVSINETQNNI